MNIEELNTALAQIFASDDLLKNEPMSKHTTFRCGGPAQFFVRASNAADITAAISAAEKADVPWWIVGCGSDLLVSDAGLPGVVIEIGERMAHISIDGSIVHAQAGATNEAVAQAALEAELSGYEFASGIPGSVGGAAIMNAGAYDGEFKDIAVSVSCLFPDGTVREIPAEEADWSYRHSMMSDKGLVVLGATLQLASGNKDDIRAKMDDLVPTPLFQAASRNGKRRQHVQAPRRLFCRQTHSGFRHARPFSWGCPGFHQACWFRGEYRQRKCSRCLASYPRRASGSSRPVRRYA